VIKKNRALFTNLFHLLFAFFVSVHVFPNFIYAYIDPGSGGYLSQVILAAVLSSVVMLKLYWKKIVSFFTKILPNKKQKDEKKDSS
jgi:hypothetical protein